MASTHFLHRTPCVQSAQFIPTWLFPEEYILGSIAGLDDKLLQSVDLGRLFISLKERQQEESAALK
jgi:hypothetical protein